MPLDLQGQENLHDLLEVRRRATGPGEEQAQEGQRPQPFTYTASFPCLHHREDVRDEHDQRVRAKGKTSVAIGQKWSILFGGRRRRVPYMRKWRDRERERARDRDTELLGFSVLVEREREREEKAYKIGPREGYNRRVVSVMKGRVIRRFRPKGRRQKMVF